jgi:hypothetical protein
MINYSFNEKSQRYYDLTNGRFVSRNEVKNAVNQNISNKAKLAEDIAQAYNEKQINNAEFEQLMAKLIKTNYIQNYKIGKPNLTAGDNEAIRQRLVDEYTYLRRFTNDLTNLTPNQITARAKSYFTNTSSFDEGSRRSYRQGGWIWERRKTSIAEHCGDCVSYASMGWQLIGTLPPIGTRSACLGNCKCYFEFSKSITRPR